MINGRCIGIDARMIEMSGIGTYIQHLMGQGIYDYAIGNEEEIRRYDKNVKIIPYTAPIYSPTEQLKYPIREIKAAGIKLMHFPHYNVPLFYKGDYIVTVHDLTHIVLPEFLGNRIKYYYAKCLMSHALKHAKHILTVSENSKKDIIKYFKTPEEKITITYNAIDDDFKVKDRQEIEYLYNKYDIPKNKKLILYVGNLKPHKNLGTLLSAFKQLENEEAELLLVGKAFKSLELDKQEETLGIKDKVIHTGLVSKEELVDLYNLADLFVFPSLYEGFGIPPLEAMACGTPVIAANNSSIPEVVGDAAILVDGKDAGKMADIIYALMDQEKTRRELTDKGFERIKVFSWQKTVDEVTRVLSI